MRPQEAEKKYLEILRGMTGEQRLVIAFELYEMVRNIAISAIAEQNPGISPLDMEKELRKRMGYDSARDLASNG